MRPLLVFVAAVALVLGLTAPGLSRPGKEPQAPTALLEMKLDWFQLTAGSFCLSDSSANPPFARGACLEKAPAQLEVPTIALRCRSLARFYIAWEKPLSSLVLRLGTRSFTLTPQTDVGPSDSGSNVFQVGRWRVRGRTGLATLSAAGEQGQARYYARFVLKRRCR